jgi:5'-nucleotidase
MPFPIEEKLVIAIASSALFDLRESDAVFRERGIEEYRRFQKEHENSVLRPGVAFPFINRLLSLNKANPDQPVEVVLLSRNDPDTGLRVFKSIQNYGLGISRGAFVSGRSPYRYIGAFNASLFLSAEQSDVEEAIMHNCPAGRVLNSDFTDDPEDQELRVAFDFDCVLVDDEAERIFQAEGLSGFHAAEQQNALLPHAPGPMKNLLLEIAKLQQREIQKEREDPAYKPMIRTAIVTSRNAPAHERLVTTLREWGIRVDETFFLGGMDKNRVLEVFRPHIFFDDQMTYAGKAAGTVPSVHVPFGIVNVPAAKNEPVAQAAEERDKPTCI